MRGDEENRRHLLYERLKLHWMTNLLCRLNGLIEPYLTFFLRFRSQDGRSMSQTKKATVNNPADNAAVVRTSPFGRTNYVSQRR